jgi:hypothetical protein
MISQYQIPAENGSYELPFQSIALNRMVSISYTTNPTSGTVKVEAMPYGRTNYMPIDGAGEISATSESSFTMSYPVKSVKVTLSGFSGGNLVNIAFADAWGF